MSPPLWTHQRAGLGFLLPKPATMIGAGLGTGKSAIFYHANSAWNCRRTLVICPPSVRSVHRRMAPLHSPTTVRAVILDQGSVAKRTAQADAALRDPSPVVLAVNTEAVWREPMARWILDHRWDCVCADESHLGGIKTPGTNASEFMARLTPISGHRICLSGTFMGQSPLDAFGQYRFLDPSIFGLDYDAFLKRYYAPKLLNLRKKCKSSRANLLDAIAGLYGKDSPLLDLYTGVPDGSESVPGIKNSQEFADRIAPITWTCKTADVLDLPPMVSDYREVSLAPEGKRLYNQILREGWTDAGDGEVTINSLFTLQMRLQQITSGHVGTDDRVLYRLKDNPKAEALRDLLAECGKEPAVVFTRFVADLDVVEKTCRDLHLRYAELSGRRKDAVTNLATLRPGIDVAGVQPKSGGVGIDLSAASIGIWYSLARSLPEYDQGVSRLHRPGTRGTRMYSIVCRDSIDQTIHEAIADRREVIEAIFKKLKRPGLTADINPAYNAAC